MSREIGFRVYDTKEKRYAIDGMIYFFDIIAGRNKRYILEQDTGLKDKNGKRICEGDIVRLYGRYVSAITWQDDYCGFRWHHEVDGYCGLGKDNEEYYEVIGNIHENGELLGGEE